MICDNCTRTGTCHLVPHHDHNDNYRCELFTCAPAITDTGNRTQFETGAVRDMHAGKGRMDLLPWAAIMELSKHAERGAVKYGERNIDKGVPMHSLLDSGLRHLAKYMEGATDEPHLVAALWNIAWAVQFEVNRPEMQDIESRRTGR